MPFQLGAKKQNTSLFRYLLCCCNHLIASKQGKPCALRTRGMKPYKINPQKKFLVIAVGKF